MEEMLRVQKQQNVTIQKLKAANEELVAEKEELDLYSGHLDFVIAQSAITHSKCPE